MTDLIGRAIGQYQIVEQIGKGGMADVYKAYQPGLDRYVAIKILPEYFLRDETFLARFHREAKAIAKLSHSHILPVYDFGQHDNLTYIVMQYVEAGTLQSMLGRPLDLKLAADIIAQVADALDYAHEQGIVHRDVKPSNVLMERGRRALLSDFGLAKMTEATVQLTGSGVGVGTPAYMSPEQGQGKGVDARSDVYSLGVVLYEMLTGRVPYEAETPMAVVIKHITAPLPLPRAVNPAIPEAVEWVVLKALAKAPADRYQTTGEMATALKKAAEGVKEAVPVVGPEVRETEVKPMMGPATMVKTEEEVAPIGRRVPLWVWGAVGGMVLLIVVAGVFLVSQVLKLGPTIVARATTPAATSVATPAGAAPAVGVTEQPTTAPSPTATPLPPTSADTPTSTPTETPTSTSTLTPETATSTPTPMPTTTPSPAPTDTLTNTPMPAPQTPAPEPIATPDFGGKLAIPLMFGLERKVYITGLDGKDINGPEPISLYARQPMFSRDGKSLIVNGKVGGLSGVFMTGDRGQAPKVLIDRDSAYWPVLSPDGSDVIFAEMTLDGRLHRRKGDGTISEVTANGGPILAKNVLWSDDNRLVFEGCAVWRGQPGECGIWVTDANNVNPVRIVVGTAGWPTDAKKGMLVYMSAEDGDWDIYLVSLDGKGLQNITNNDSPAGLAAIAPDGKSVAYISKESGKWALWTVTLSSKEKRQWFDIDPQRGTIDVNDWAGERMSWTK